MTNKPFSADDQTMSNDWRILRERAWDWHDQHVIVRPFVDALVAELTRLRAERDALQKQLAIERLSVPLTDDLHDKIDELMKYLAMEDGFTLAGIARLLIDCQRRMAADWTEIGNDRRRVKAADARYTALLIDLRAILDEYNTKDGDLYRFVERIAARLSREPHQD